MGWVGYKWARSASKHRISRERTIYVIERCGKTWTLPPDEDHPDERLLFLGDDPSGNQLEVVGVELVRSELLVVHSMRMRRQYRELYRKALAWQM